MRGGLPPNLYVAGGLRFCRDVDAAGDGVCFLAGITACPMRRRCHPTRRAIRSGGTLRDTHRIHGWFHGFFTANRIVGGSNDLTAGITRT